MSEVMMYLPIDMVYPNPNNPRKHFDPESMAELVASVRQVGILQPVVVVMDIDAEKFLTRYRLVAGERRYRAALEAGIKDLPAVVRDLTPEQELEVMIIENLQRKNVDPIEEAQGFKALLDAGGYTQESLAEKLGCSQSHIANRLRLLRLPEDVQQNISRKIISAGHANALLKLEKTPKLMEKAVEAIVEDNTPVARASQTVSVVIAENSKPLWNRWGEGPEFDVSQCEGCDYRVVGTEYTGAPEKPYCLMPVCWEKAQEKAKRERLDELTSKSQGEIIDTGKLSYSKDYVFWHEGANDYDQTECLECEKRKLGKRDIEKDASLICLEPDCMNKKRRALSREKSREARDAFKAELEQVNQLAREQANMYAKNYIDRDLLIYFVAQILANIVNTYDRKVTRYQYLKDKLGWDNDFLKNGHARLLEDDWELFKAKLKMLSDQQLLELAFEWPAVGQGLAGIRSWMLSPGGDEQCKSA